MESSRQLIIGDASVTALSILSGGGPARFQSMACRKQVYKITYSNGKIYVGMDLTGPLLYVGSPST